MPLSFLKKSSVFIIVIMIVVAYSVITRIYSETHTELPNIQLDGLIPGSGSAITGMEVDQNSPTAFLHTEYSFRFTPPSSWAFFDVGLPVEEKVMIETKEELPVVIYLFNTTTEAVMDLQVINQPDSQELSGTKAREYTTKYGYSAQIHDGDCSVFDEPKFMLKGDSRQSLLVTVDELCEEDEWKSKDTGPLLTELADSFEFDYD